MTSLAEEVRVTCSICGTAGEIQVLRSHGSLWYLLPRDWVVNDTGSTGETVLACGTCVSFAKEGPL